MSDRRIEYSQAPRQVVRATQAVAIARGVGTIMSHMAPHLDGIGKPVPGGEESVSDMHGHAVLTDLDGKPSIYVIVSVMLPSDEARAKVRRIAAGEAP